MKNIYKTKKKYDTEFFIKVLVRETQDEFKRIHQETRWIKLDKDLELGSLKNPKKYKGMKILEVKWNVPGEQKRENIFEGLFKGLI